MSKKISSIVTIIVLALMLLSCASANNEILAENFDASTARKHEESDRADGTGASSEKRMVTYTVRLSIAVKSIDPAKTAIIEQMKNYKGFIVVETGNSITMRIPAENMDSFISTAKTLGETESENKIGKDITDQYRDDVIRLNNLKKVRDRYLELLEQADAVGDILNIEKELERVNTQIEQLEGRKKYAEESVALSDITIRFYEKVRLGPLGWVFYGVYLGIAWLFVWD